MFILYYIYQMRIVLLWWQEQDDFWQFLSTRPSDFEHSFLFCNSFRELFLGQSNFVNSSKNTVMFETILTYSCELFYQHFF